ncbi:MAG: TIGR00153 family protein [Kosmotoga sp.]|uniref:TIGR00153 family protein n=1 Tax=Kosmotoga sp. TaxID=1955248 RepID=UPI001D310D69|nr:TIGR00153 family protein [Kosmotoga sp.]MBO8167263.1 TIGR00153 family protein [Kosmotoga sp.]MCD6159005.1 TIGR00153 family protein [Kosmotoga sp.]
MLFLGKKEILIIELFKEHLDAVEKTILSLEKYLSDMQGKDPEKVKESYDEIHERETKADSIRRRMESEMYQGAFLPNFRGDLLGLVENFDRIANSAESISDQIYLQKMKIPQDIHKEIVVQLEFSLKTFRALKKAAELMFEDLEKAGELVIETEKLEHEEDIFERKLIEKIYSTELSLAEKMQLRELVTHIGSLADLSEDCSDRIEIVILKRRV